VGMVCNVIWQVRMYHAGLLRHQSCRFSQAKNAERTIRTMHCTLRGSMALANGSTSGYQTQYMRRCKILCELGGRHHVKYAKPVSG
jgi:hypothetical protein